MSYVAHRYRVIFPAAPCCRRLWLNTHEYNILSDASWMGHRQSAHFVVSNASFFQEATNFLQFVKAIIAGVFDAEHVDAEFRPVDGFQNWKLGSLHVKDHEVDVTDSKRCHDRVEREALHVRLGNIFVA